jgi:hypothetical protein
LLYYPKRIGISRHIEVQDLIKNYKSISFSRPIHPAPNRTGGGDLAATDSTRVLRLPSFANRKLSEEFIVQARHESDVVYMPRDFTIQEDSPETPRDSQTNPFPCTIQIAFVLLARSGAPGGIRTPGLLVRRKAVKNSKCCFWSLTGSRVIYLALELDRSWTEMTGVNP